MVTFLLMEQNPMAKELTEERIDLTYSSRGFESAMVGYHTASNRQ